MAKNAFKILRCEYREIFKVCLTILQHCAWEGEISWAHFLNLTIILIKLNMVSHDFPTELTFTCSKLTIEMLEKGAKYVQSHILQIFLVFLGMHK